jgi:flagella basal body P-ring formation protein FlgA
VVPPGHRPAVVVAAVVRSLHVLSDSWKVSGLFGQQRVKPARAIQRGQIIVAADMRVADVDLRHGAPPGLFHHFSSARRITINIDFFNLRHALFCQ